MTRMSVRDACSAIRLRLIRIFRPDRYQEAAILYTAARYDMSSAPAEDFFADLYLRFMGEDLTRVFGEQKISILDVGCGQGRLSLPLAEQGHRVTGIDISPEAIAAAGRRAKKAGIDAEFKVLDIIAAPEQIPDQAFDCVLCTEMIYMTRDPAPVLSSFARIVRPGGLVIVSFRPRQYYLLLAVKGGYWDDLATIAGSSGGNLHGTWLNWCSRDEAEVLLARAGIGDVRFRAIGKFSGIAGDPQAAICNPAGLDPAARQALAELEFRQADVNVECGRYLYAAGTAGKR